MFSRLALSRCLSNKIFNPSFLPTQNQLKKIIRRNYSENKFIKTETGEWYVKENNVFKIGLMKDSIEQLSEIVFVESLVEEGDSVKENDELVAVESVKATDAIISPVDGSVEEINANLFDELDDLNNDPEDIDNSWIIKIKS